MPAFLSCFTTSRTRPLRLQVVMAQALTGGIQILDIEITTVEAELDRTVLRWMR